MSRYLIRGDAVLASRSVAQRSDLAMLEPLFGMVEIEYQSGRDEGEEKAARRWAEKRSPGGHCDVGWRSGLLIATLPASAFTGGGRDILQPQRIGSFVKMAGWWRPAGQPAVPAGQ